MFHKPSFRFVFIVSILTIATYSYAAPNTTGLLFFAPFQNSVTPTTANGGTKVLHNENVAFQSGKVGNAVSTKAGQSQLVFDGPGNAYSEAGTASFYWRLDADPAGKPVTILNLSPLEKTDNERYLLLSYVAGKFRLYLSAGIEGGQTMTSPSIMILPGAWHHILLCWDQSFGTALVVDGEIAFQSRKSWIYNGAIGAIGMGIANTPGRPPSTSFSQSFDELRIYDRWLEDAGLKRLIQGQAASTSRLHDSRLKSDRSKSYRWSREYIARLPQVKVAIGGGLGLRQANAGSTQSAGRQLFDGERAAFWPPNTSTFNQTLPITVAENRSFDVLQMLGIGHLQLIDNDNKRVLVDSKSDDLTQQSFMVTGHGRFVDLSLKTLPPEGKDTFKSGAASNFQLFRQIHYPYEFDKTWQNVSLRQAANADQSLDAMQQIRRAFYSSDQRAFMAKDGLSSGQVEISAMRTFHIVGPAQTQDRELSAVAIELQLLGRIPAFVRVQVTDPQNPLHFLVSADVHLNNGPGLMRLMLDHRNVSFPPGQRPLISITFSDDATLELKDSRIRYQWN